MLSRLEFINSIQETCRSSTLHSTLVYMEINHVTEVISLLQGLQAEQDLINTVEQFIVSIITGHSGSIVGKLESNRFGVILKLPVSDSIAIANDIVAILDQRTITIDENTYYPKLTIGVTPLTPEYSSPEIAIAAADEALYQARRIGHSIVQLVEPDNPKLLEYHQFLKLLPILRDGLVNESFILYAQPIIPLAGQNSVKKYEILLRYQDENVEIHQPDKFLSTAGLFHVSREIDLYVVHQFCRFYRQNQNRDCSYAINISGNTVRYPEFFHYVAKEFKQYGVNPKHVCFEMTENVTVEDTLHATELMSKLKHQLGCQLALDDIGIGSSNLSNLPKFDVDFLKIDGSYVTSVTTCPYAELVIRFFTSAAKQFNRQTVAEYVENQQQLDKLKELGVDYGQGFLLGKPKKLYDPASEQ